MNAQMPLTNLWPRVAMRLTQRTAQLLQGKGKELAEIKWADGEANTDSGFSRLACLCCVEAWDTIKGEYPEYMDITLQCKSPDITLSFSQGETAMAAKIELKQGKGKGLIPGSTILSLDINEPVIFCLRNESDNTFRFCYEQYHACMGESDTEMFQNRSPRPYVNFEKMTDILSPVEYVHKEKGDWVEHYAKCALNRIKGNRKSWQDDMVAAILRRFVEDTSVEEFTRMKNPLQ